MRAIEYIFIYNLELVKRTDCFIDANFEVLRASSLHIVMK